MAKLKKAFRKDIERILPLLASFGENAFTYENCDNLFAQHLFDDDGSIGYILEHDTGKVVGFLGYAYSRRSFDSQVIRFCNMHSWIVEEKYRSSSISLLLPLIKDREITITNFSPTTTVQDICIRLGFETFDTTVHIIPAFYAFLGFPKKRSVSLLYDTNRITECSNRSVGEFIKYHSLPHHRHALIKSSGDYCYVMMNRTMKKVGPVKLPFLRVHHLSNPKIFVNNLYYFLYRVAIREKVVGLLVSEYLLRNNTIRHALCRGSSKGLYRLSETWHLENIDALYTEMTQMNY